MNDSDLHRGAELRRLLLTSKDTMLQAHDALANLKSITSDRGGARADLGSSLRDLAAVTASLRGFRHRTPSGTAADRPQMDRLLAVAVALLAAACAAPALRTYPLDTAAPCLTPAPPAASPADSRSRPPT
jgi:hypothetical protein